MISLNYSIVVVYLQLGNFFADITFVLFISSEIQFPLAITILLLIYYIFYAIIISEKLFKEDLSYE